MLFVFSQAAAAPPRLAREYCDVLVTYAVHAKTLWHLAEPGGYWGDGIDAKNQNGAVRGMCNTMLTYSMLAHALDQGDWIAPEDAAELTSAGLTRDELLRYMRENLQHLIAHHKSATPPLKPEWGYGWQSSLWLGALGPAVFLQWKNLSPGLQEGVKRIAFAEADFVSSKPPKSFHKHDTGAEENGWNTGSLALAVALAGDDTRAEKWWKALRVYAVNTYSVPEDKQSTGTVGSDRISEIVSTANLFSDFTLDNHGFFHPDYVQVSGQHLGEAWLILKWGDSLFNTSRSDAFLPYAQHHLSDVWQKVLKPLLLPSGEFAFPSGNDWTFHCSTNQSYFAYIATRLKDGVAAAAEERALDHVRRRRAASPAGRLLGDSNIEWWWEPLVAKRSCTALMHHMANREVVAPEGDKLNDFHIETRFPDSKVWSLRTPAYYASASWGTRRMGYFVPFGENYLKRPYLTIPAEDGILPDDVTTGTHGEAGPKDVTLVFLQRKGGKNAVCVAFPNSVLWLSADALRGVAIENDSLTTPGRKIRYEGGERLVAALVPEQTFETSSTWVTIDDELALFSPNGFQYKPAGKWNRKSVAVDKIFPAASPGVLWMVGGVSAEKAKPLAAEMSVTYLQGRATMKLKDGPSGQTYSVTALLDPSQQPAGVMYQRPPTYVDILSSPVDSKGQPR